ncbi:MAG: type III secretion system needle filament subunit SctF [Pseudomonadota bacterium]
MDMNSIEANFGQSVTNADTALRDITATADPNNPMDMLKMQQAMTSWSMAINAYSTAMKTVKDTVSGIIQKMS